MATTGNPQRSNGEKSPRLKDAPGRRRRGKKREREAAITVAAPMDLAVETAPPESEHVVAAMKRIGTTLAGKWRLHMLLGVGGMAAVFGATHRNGNRVAIKMLHPVLGHSRHLRERFLREGYAANRVDHEGVVRVLDDDELEDGSAFLVMELLSGETLESRWQRAGNRLPLAEVLGVADELLSVLGAAHAKGIHHRDIKPENVFLTNKGRLKVLDFGIAQMLDAMPGSVTTTSTGVALGTPAFMPPEQALGRSREIDGRTDLWAVGATMFTLLTGRFVHLTDSPAEMLVLAATERAPALATVMPHVPVSVAAIVDRALSFEQGGRFADAASMLSAVRAARVELGYLDAERDPQVDDEPAVASSPLPSSTAPVAISTSAPAPVAVVSRGRPRLRTALALAAVAALLSIFAVPVSGFQSASVVDSHAQAASLAVGVPEDVAPPAAEPGPEPVAAPTPVVAPSASAARAAMAPKRQVARPAPRKPFAKRGPSYRP